LPCSHYLNAFLFGHIEINKLWFLQLKSFITFSFHIQLKNFKNITFEKKISQRWFNDQSWFDFFKHHLNEQESHSFDSWPHSLLYTLFLKIWISPYCNIIPHMFQCIKNNTFWIYFVNILSLDTHIVETLICVHN